MIFLLFTFRFLFFIISQGVLKKNLFLFKRFLFIKLKKLYIYAFHQLFNDLKKSEMLNYYEDLHHTNI